MSQPGTKIGNEAETKTLEYLLKEVSPVTLSLLRIDIDLGFTFLDIAHVSYGMGQILAGDKALDHARNAAENSRRSLRRLSSMSGKDRDELEGLLDGLDNAILLAATPRTHHAAS